MSYYAMHRGWMSHPAFEKEPFSERDAWLWLIENAVISEATVNHGGKPVKIGRGQLSYSIRFLAEAWKWHRCKVERYLEKLKIWDMIETANETGQQVITIRNYKKYQDDKNSTETLSRRDPSQKRDTSETNTKNVNNVKKDIPKGISSRAAALKKPDDVSEEVWRDFKIHRKAKKAPITETALSQIRREAEKAGMTLQQALTEAVARNWQGFKAKWLENEQVKNGHAASIAGTHQGRHQSQTGPSIDERTAALKARFGSGDRSTSDPPQRSAGQGPGDGHPEFLLEDAAPVRQEGRGL